MYVYYTYTHPHAFFSAPDDTGWQINALSTSVFSTKLSLGKRSVFLKSFWSLKLDMLKESRITKVRKHPKRVVTPRMLQLYPHISTIPSSHHPY